MKAKHLDRQALKLIALQLQNDFALLRYLLFSDKDTSTKDSATSPLLNPNPNPNPTSSVSTLHCTHAPNFRCSTPVGAMGSPRAKTKNSSNADFQPLLNTQEVPSSTVQNLAARIGKLEKLFTDEVATYPSITAGIQSQYFFLYDKIRQLKTGNSDVIIWKIPSVKFVFESAKVARPSSDPLIDPATSCSSPIFRTHPHGYNFFIKFTLMVLDPLLASVLQYYSPSSLAITTIFSNGPLKDHPHWYSRSTGPIKQLDEDNPTGSGPSLQEAHNVNKNWSHNSPN